MRRAKPRSITCGTLVTDGRHCLLGHATGSSYWDIPKGLVESGEDPRQAAARELREETGLLVLPEQLSELGLHAYRPGKDLALFAWCVPTMPDPATLICASKFTDRFGRIRPEFDRFAVVERQALANHVGRSLWAVLARVPLP